MLGHKLCNKTGRKERKRATDRNERKRATDRKKTI